MIIMFETPMFGVHHQPEGKDWQHMKKTLHLVEDNGYDLFTVTDHFMNIANPDGPYNHPLEAWTLLAALAAETKKNWLAPLVSCYGYRRPTVRARIEMRRREALSLIIILGFIVLYAYQTYDTELLLEPIYTYQVVNKYSHDTDAFTQGLVLYNGVFYEGTGLRGESSLRIVKPETGEIIKIINLSPEYFGEGVTIHGDKVYQLTWREKTGFVYDLDLNQISTWTFTDEGWGLTENGTHLIMSDGTSKLSYISPETLTIVDIITITSEGEEITSLNELEYIEGYIYANIWQTDQIAIIDPVTGVVASWIDLTGLMNELDSKTGIDVLNGIAYDKETGKIYVTGKLWPNLFEIKIIPK